MLICRASAAPPKVITNAHMPSDYVQLLKRVIATRHAASQSSEIASRGVMRGNRRCARSHAPVLNAPRLWVANELILYLLVCNSVISLGSLPESISIALPVPITKPLIEECSAAFMRLQPLVGQLGEHSTLVSGVEHLAASSSDPIRLQTARRGGVQRSSGRKACGVSCAGLQHVCKASNMRLHHHISPRRVVTTQRHPCLVSDTSGSHQPPCAGTGTGAETCAGFRTSTADQQHRIPARHPSSACRTTTLRCGAVLGPGHSCVCSIRAWRICPSLPVLYLRLSGAHA